MVVWILYKSAPLIESFAANGNRIDRRIDFTPPLFVHSSDNPHGDQKNYNNDFYDGSGGLNV